MVIRILVNLIASVQVKFTVQRVTITLIFLEELYSGGLLYPTFQDASHTLYRGLAQLVRLSAIVVDASVSLIQAPYRGGAIYTFADTADLPVGRDLRKQACYAALMTQQLPLNDSIIYIQLSDGVLVVRYLEKHIGIYIYHAALPYISNLRDSAEKLIIVFFIGKIFIRVFRYIYST